MKSSVARLSWMALFTTALSTVAAAGSGKIFLHEDFETLDRWKPLVFPLITNHSTYAVLRKEGHSVLGTESKASASGLILSGSFDVRTFPVLAWRWKVDGVYAGTDPQSKSGDDYPIRLYAIFEYDPKVASFGTRMKYRLAKARLGEYPPVAALNYVWASGESPPFFFSPYSNRSVMVPLQAGAGHVGEWMEERVNLVEDYRRIFGADPPARASLAIMNDSDNTGRASVSYIAFLEIRGR